MHRLHTPAMNATNTWNTSSRWVQDLPAAQPICQQRIWDRFKPGDGPEKMAQVIEQLKREDHRFHVDGGSWTNDISWVRGYDNVLGPMERVSSLFFEKVLKAGVSPADPRYRNALFHLLCSQTSCYRYWGQGVWTDYGREICRRLEAILHTIFDDRRRDAGVERDRQSRNGEITSPCSCGRTVTKSSRSSVWQSSTS